MTNQSVPEGGFSNIFQNKQDPVCLAREPAIVSLMQLGSLDCFPLPVWVINKQGLYVQVNTTFCNLFGYSSLELQQENELSSTKTASIKSLYTQLVQGKEIGPKEWELKTKWGETKFVQYKIVLATDHTPEPLIVFLGTDIKSVKSSKAMLRADLAQALKEIELLEFTEDLMFHDVRKPIANIISICTLLLKDYDAQKNEYWLNILQKEALKSLKILDTKAGIRNLELKNYPLEYSAFNVVELIQSILKPLEPKTQKHSLQVKLYLNNTEQQELESLEMTADKFLIEIMLNNIITNAIEASPENGQVNIFLNRDSKGKIQISIHNQGAIPVKIRSRFFQKYTTFGKPKGFGIGTYIAKLIACSHNGDISFTSSKQKGTMVHLNIPTLQATFSA